jgi:hypothetical protein
MEQNYKQQQAANKQRMCQQYKGPAAATSEKKVIIDPNNGRIYAWDHTGIKVAGVRVGGEDFSILRVPANKKEKRKAIAGLPYRDKKGKVEKDVKQQMS